MIPWKSTLRSARFVACGVEGRLRYSDQSTIDARLQDIAHDFHNQLAKLDQRQKVPFNRMAEWGLMEGLGQTLGLFAIYPPPRKS